MKEEKDFKKFKKEYEKLMKKYHLPKFDEINREFEIERLYDEETSFLLRYIRRAMMEKLATYMKFLEYIINPSSAPYFFLIIANYLDEEGKKISTNLYLKIGKFYAENISLDSMGDNKKDAEFINRLWKEWDNIKKDFLAILDKTNKSFDSKKSKKDKGYIH